MAALRKFISQAGTILLQNSKSKHCQPLFFVRNSSFVYVPDTPRPEYGECRVTYEQSFRLPRSIRVIASTSFLKNLIFERGYCTIEFLSVIHLLSLPKSVNNFGKLLD